MSKIYDPATYTYTHITDVATQKLLDKYEPALAKIPLSILLDTLISGADTFLELNDTPAAYAGQAGLCPIVNVGETALEFEARTVPVSPSIVGNIVTFSGVTGEQADSGVSIESVTLAPFEVAATVDVVANATNVGTGFAIIIPAHSVLYGFMIEADAPGGTAGGAKTIQYSIGTIQNVNNDLADPTDVDIMIATGAIVAVASVHGDQTADHVGAFFPMDMHGVYFPIITTIWVNYIGQSADATANPGTVTCDITVYPLVGSLA